MFGAVLNRLATSVRRALSQYAVGANEPELALNFIDNEYITNNSTSTFASAVTHARAGNATMTDGYGPELVVNGGFDSDSDWTKGTGWSIYDSKATHASGTASNLEQSFTPVVGRTYAISFHLSGRTAGTVRPEFIGGSTVVGTSTGTNGQQTQFLTAASGNNTIKFGAGSAFDGSIDNVSVREMPVIKWAPHNLLTYSEDLSQLWTVASGAVKSSTTEIDPNGGNTAALITNLQNVDNARINRNLAITEDSTFGVFLKGTAGETINIEHGTDAQTVTLTSDWKLYTLDATAPQTTLRIINRAGCTADEVYFAFPHVFRSDLGGMVDNPDQPSSRASYVPTTSAAKYLPRIGHHVFNGSAWSNEGLLAESEQRVNLVPYSDFRAIGGFGDTRCTLTIDQAVSPDGNQNASEIVEDTNTGSHFIADSITVTASTDYTLSAYVKQGSGSRSAVLRTNDEGTDDYAVFDFDSETITETGSGTSNATSQNVGNGWYRIAFTYTQSADTSSGFIVALSNSTTPSSSLPSYTGDGTSSIYVYGAQFEQGSTPSSLIPTSGSSVSRAAETFTIPSANLPWPEPTVLNTAWTADLSSDTNWALTSSWVVSSNALSNSGSLAYDVARYDEGPLVSGKVYELVFDINSVSGAGVRARYSGGILDTFTTTGTKKIVFVATVTASEDIDFQTNGAGVSATIDNISVREINPLSVSIAMDGRMTYADTGDSNEVRFFEWLEDGSNYLASQIRTDSTRTGAIYVAYNNGGTFDSVSSSDTYYSPDILVPYNQAVRVTSTDLNYAADGVSGTANTTLTSLVDLSDDDLTLAKKLMGTIGTFRVWDRDITDDGLVEATNPSLEPSLSLDFLGTGTTSFTVSDWSE